MRYTVPTVTRHWWSQTRKWYALFVCSAKELKGATSPILSYFRCGLLILTRFLYMSVLLHGTVRFSGTYPSIRLPRFVPRSIVFQTLFGSKNDMQTYHLRKYLKWCVSLLISLLLCFLGQIGSMGQFGLQQGGLHYSPQTDHNRPALIHTCIIIVGHRTEFSIVLIEPNSPE